MNISTLSDEELNRAMIWLNPIDWVECDDGITSRGGDYEGYIRYEYLSDWSLTGPLMVKYELNLTYQPLSANWRCLKVERFYTAGGGTVKETGATSQNPLRAICECVLMIESAIVRSEVVSVDEFNQAAKTFDDMND